MIRRPACWSMTATLKLALAESDCLLVAGCKLGESLPSASRSFRLGKTVIHTTSRLIEEIVAPTRTEVALVGDAGLALEDLSAALTDGKLPAGGTRILARPSAQADGGMAGKRPRPLGPGEADQRRPPDAELNKAMPADRGGGRGLCRAHWAGLLFDTKAGWSIRLIEVFGLDRYGVPGGIGSLAAGATRRVVALTGEWRWRSQHEPGRARDKARRLSARQLSALSVFNNAAASGFSVKARCSTPSMARATTSHRF